MLLARMRDGLYYILLSVVCSAVCAGQQSGARHDVTGTVVNSATGEPIARALVMTSDTPVLTGADGRFKLANVPEGALTLAAQKPGYFECGTQNCEGGGMGHAMVTVHAGMGDVILKLAPESFIEGRILDENGEPVSNLQVMARVERISEGMKQFAPSGASVTDENGSYRIEELMGGKYSVETAPRLEFEFAYPDSAAPSEIYPRMFYPNTREPRGAQLLELKPGESARADFVIRAVAGVKIGGTVAPRFPWIALSIADESGEEMPVERRFYAQTGKFEVVVPAGTWTLRFSGNGADGVNYSATETVTADSRIIEGLRVALQPLASVPLKVSDATNGEEKPDVIVSLVSRDGPAQQSSFFGGPGRSKFSQDANEIANVSPGRYMVRLSAPNRCVEGITSGSVDLTQNDLEIQPGAQTQPINISLREDCATLDVKVQADNPESRNFVILIPASKASAPLLGQVTGTTATRFGLLSPGDYQLYAFSSVDGLEYANPEVMREFSGQQVTVSANQQASVTLNAIRRGP